MRILHVEHHLVGPAVVIYIGDLARVNTQYLCEWTHVSVLFLLMTDKILHNQLYYLISMHNATRRGLGEPCYICEL